MKYFYYVFQIEENEKYYAWAVKISEVENLLSRIQRTKNLICVHQCKTFSDAKNISASWNSCHKLYGTYLFDETF